MEMKERLVEEISSTPTITQSTYFIDRYNRVIETYNSSLTTPDIQLETLDNSQSFAKLSHFLAQPLTKIGMIILLAFAPIANLFILGMLVFYYLFLMREGKKHKNNLKRVKNPMESFYFLPQICHQLGKHCTTLTINTKDIEGFTFNELLHQQLKARSKQSDVITVVIYDQYFYDSYHLFKKEQYKIAAWILLSTILITADIIFYAALLHFY